MLTRQGCYWESPDPLLIHPGLFSSYDSGSLRCPLLWIHFNLSRDIIGSIILWPRLVMIDRPSPSKVLRTLWSMESSTPWKTNQIHQPGGTSTPPFLMSFGSTKLVAVFWLLWSFFYFILFYSILFSFILFYLFLDDYFILLTPPSHRLVIPHPGLQLTFISPSLLLRIF